MQQQVISRSLSFNLKLKIYTWLKILRHCVRTLRHQWLKLDLKGRVNVERLPYSLLSSLYSLGHQATYIYLAEHLAPLRADSPSRSNLFFQLSSTAFDMSPRKGLSGCWSSNLKSQDVSPLLSFALSSLPTRTAKPLHSTSSLCLRPDTVSTSSSWDPPSPDRTSNMASRWGTFLISNLCFSIQLSSPHSSS